MLVVLALQRASPLEFLQIHLHLEFLHLRFMAYLQLHDGLVPQPALRLRCRLQLLDLGAIRLAQLFDLAGQPPEVNALETSPHCVRYRLRGRSLVRIHPEQRPRKCVHLLLQALDLGLQRSRQLTGCLGHLNNNYI